MEKNNEYKGYGLFNDIEDAVLRNRNQGVILANIATMNIREGKITPKGVSLICKGAKTYHVVPVK